MAYPVEFIIDAWITIIESPLGINIIKFHFIVILNMVGCEVLHKVEIIPTKGP